MPNAKKTTSEKTNGHGRHGVIPREQIALLEKDYRKLKTDRARERFMDQLTEEESYYLWLTVWDAERTREKLEMIGVM